MGYRGHDLDLRTPQTWRASPDDLADSASPAKAPNGPVRGQVYGAEREIPIWVDDTVLACCNHAYDVALAHRSGEVRVEHLLHALTRIDDASDILEGNGIRAASLRRETATVIASDLPVTLTNGSGSPRRSDAFEEVLRLAAAHAYQRNQPVSVEDLLYVFLEMRPAIRGIELIEHHLVKARRGNDEPRDPGYRRRTQPAYVPPFDTVAFEPRPYRERERERQRPRRQGGRFAPPEPIGRDEPVASHETVQAATDHLQNSRLDALEQMVRAISRQITSQRDEASRHSGGLYDRLKSLEALLAARGDGNALGGIEQLLVRLDDVEQTVRARAPRDPDLTPLLDRLALMERRLGEVRQGTGPAVDLRPLIDRLDGIERRLGDVQLAGGSAADLRPLADRLDAIERRLGEVRATAGTGTDVRPLVERLEGIERRLSAMGTASGTVVDLAPVVDRLVALERKLAEAGPARIAEPDLVRVEQRLRELDQQSALRLNQGLSSLAQRLVQIEQKSALGDVANKLALIEEAVLGSDGKAAGDIDGRIADLAEAVSLQQATLDDVRASLAAEVQELNGALNDQSTHLARTGESLGELVRAVESLRDEERNTVAQMAGLVGTYRTEVDSFVAKARETATGHAAELKEVHDALMKLNANQHALAGSIDQWHSADSGGLALIAQRMETLEREAGRPMALLQTVSASMDNLHRATVERYHRRNRFWYWLFGTDDWVAASWPSQAARIEAERVALRQGKS